MSGGQQWHLGNIQTLIGLLREHPYLWNKTLPDYRCKHKKEMGLLFIATEMNLTPAAIKYKLNNLKYRYASEMQKIRTSKKLNYFYRPTLVWFDDFKSLMESAEEPKETTQQYEIKSENVQMSSPEDEEESEEESEIKEDNEDSDTMVVSITQEYLDGVVNEQNIVDFEPKKHRKAVGRINEEPPQDEFQMFAEHLVEQLKKIPIEAAMHLENEIQNMIDEATSKS